MWTSQEEFSKIEKSALLPLPIEPFEASLWKEAVVHPDHYIQVNKKAYSIPHNYVGKKVVDARYGNGSIILTSNRSLSDWVGIFPYPIMANALLDRLCHNAHQIVINGESYRKKKNPKIENA